MPRLMPLLASLLVATAFAQTPSQKPPVSPIKATARAERPDATYKVGEKVTFNLVVTDKGKPAAGAVDWIIVKDGLPTAMKGRAELVDGKAAVQGSLDEPGFLQVRVLGYHAGAGQKPVSVSAMGGAAIDPLKIPASRPAPADFDAFWAERKAELSKVPVAPVITPVKSTLPEVDAFDLQAPCVGAPVSGYLAVPKGAAPKSLPIILTVHGAGVRGSSLGGAVSWASKGFLAMDINAHGLPNGRPESFYAEQTAGALKDYRYQGRDSREKSYFTGMFIRLVRAIDVLVARPEWNGKHVVVYGSSQGGYQAIVAAGLDHRVTFYAAGVSAGCDHTGMLANRIAGWPKFVAVDAAGKPDPASLVTSRYIDAANFASRSKAAGCALTVGFIDTTCPPTSVYAAYNLINIPKAMYDDIPSGHSQSKEASAFMQGAVMRHVGAAGGTGTR